MIPVVVHTLLLIAAGVALFRLWRLAVPEHRWLRWIVAAGFLSRALVGQLLFWISWAKLPFARSLQLGDGFWVFAQDATFYFPEAVNAADKGWAAILLFDRSAASPTYVQALAATIWFLGGAVALGVLINLFSYLGTIAILERWSRRSPEMYRAAAFAIVAFSLSPSLILWSLQPLKDSLFQLLVVAFVAACGAWQRAWHETHTWFPRVVSAALLVILLFAIAGMRWYFAGALLLATIVFMSIVALRSPSPKLHSIPAAFAAVVLLTQSLAVSAGPYLPATVAAALSPRTALQSITRAPRALMTSLEATRRGFDSTPAATVIKLGQRLQPDHPMQHAAGSAPPPSPAPSAAPQPAVAPAPAAHESKLAEAPSPAPVPENHAPQTTTAVVEAKPAEPVVATQTTPPPPQPPAAEQPNEVAVADGGQVAPSPLPPDPSPSPAPIPSPPVVPTPAPSTATAPGTIPVVPKETEPQPNPVLKPAPQQHPQPVAKAVIVKTPPQPAAAPPLVPPPAQDDAAQIRELLAIHAYSWNTNDARMLMNCYWHSPDLQVIDGEVTTKGIDRITASCLQKTRQPGGLGLLKIDGVKIVTSGDDARVTGSWNVTENSNAVERPFEALLRRLPVVGWKIVRLKFELGVTTQSRAGRLLSGTAALFIPRSLGKSLHLFEIDGGRGMLWFTELDTLLFDFVLVIVAIAVFRARRARPWRSPLVWLVILTTVCVALPVAYSVNNFGTLFRLREMIYLGILLMPLAVAVNSARA